MSKSIFTIKGGHVSFGKYTALNNININIKKGDRVALIGHNGAGKSVLIDTLIGIKKLNKGTIKYGDKDIRKKIGVQFQRKDFPMGLKFKALLKFYLDIYGLKMKDKRVDDLLVNFEIKDLLNNQMARLSGGQKQKISIVLALLNKPNYLFIDEILTGLDITSQSKVLDLIVKYIKNEDSMTIILASHNEIEIEKMADRIIVLNQGKIVSDTTVKEIFKKYKSITNYMSMIRSKYE